MVTIRPRVSLIASSLAALSLLLAAQVMAQETSSSSSCPAGKDCASAQEGTTSSSKSAGVVDPTTAKKATPSTGGEGKKVPSPVTCTPNPEKGVVCKAPLTEEEKLQLLRASMRKQCASLRGIVRMLTQVDDPELTRALTPVVAYCREHYPMKLELPEAKK